MRAANGAQARRSWLAWLGVAALLLIAVQAFRSAFVAAEGERRPAVAHQIWPSHPLPQATLALASIGASARVGQPPTAQALAQMSSAGRWDPLGVDPLLVSATASLAAGDQVRGERLLKAALHREPRSTAGHFLLADLYIRQGRIGDALANVSTLGRRLGAGGADPFAAALATYLRDPAKVAEVRPVLSKDAGLRRSVMIALADAPGSATSLRLLTAPGDAGETWFTAAFERLLAAGDIAGARRLLAAAGIRGGGTGLTAWTGDGGAGPLSWRMAATPDGLAEPVAGGPLRLVYYGRADAALASHLLLLPARRYRLQWQFGGGVQPGTFEWRMTCLEGGRQIAALPAPNGSAAGVLDVPEGCSAQRLALWGRMGDFPRTTAAELQRVSLLPKGAR